MKCLGGITDSVDMTLSTLQVMVKDREAWLAAVHGVPKSWTRLSDWTATAVRPPNEKQDPDCLFMADKLHMITFLDTQFVHLPLGIESSLVGGIQY